MSPLSAPRRVLIPLTAAQPPRPPAADAVLHDLSGQTMGTTWAVRCLLPPDQRPETIGAGIQAVLDDVVAQMSNWRGDSDIGRYKDAAAGEWVTLPQACLHVVRTALTVARDSGGAYDPSAAALVDLWGFGPGGPVAAAPDVGAIEQARERCGWREVEIDTAASRVLQPGGVSLDLCAIAKGHGVDAVSAWLCSNGVAHHLVEVGGELRGEGVKPDGMPWWVELETPPLESGPAPSPEDSASPAPIAVAMHGLAVATSGDYRRYFHDGGRRHSHTIDPRMGYPISHAVASVTVVHAECMLADALSTALTVLGPEAGMRFAAERGIAARMLLRTPDGFLERMSPAFAAMLA
ncbi:FAD:protein FMN transferase [Paracidovorax citrulli]